MKDIIFTADDYGAIPEIDEGVRQAVERRLINSVAVFPSGPARPGGYWRDSLHKLIVAANTARNADPDYKLQIGGHLSLTSGWALDPGSELGDLETKHTEKLGHRRFRSINDFQFDVSQDDVRREFEAQYEALEGALADVQPDAPEYSVSFLTTHHDVHLYHKPIFLAYVQLARDSGLPSRSYKVDPDVGPWLLFARTVSRTFYDNDDQTIEAVREFYQRVRRNPPASAETVRRPRRLNVTHTGPAPFVPVRWLDHEKEAADKRHRLLKALHEPARGVHEFVMHLIDEKVVDKLGRRDRKRMVKHYPGVEFQLLDSRFIEQRSLFGLEAHDLAEIRTHFCRWSEL